MAVTAQLYRQTNGFHKQWEELIYRNLNKKIITILPVALLGYIAIVLMIPNTGQGTLEVVKYILIPMKIIFICYGIYKIYQMLTNFRHTITVDSHPLEMLRQSLEAKFSNSKIISLLVHDASVFYYALFSWRRKPYLQTGSTSFSYHTNSSWLITILILSKILLIEGVCVHILLMQWSQTAAWVLSLGSIYVIILLIADYRAMCLNPILVSKQEIRIQYGVQMLSYIDIDNIESISMIKFENLTKEDLKTRSMPIVIEPNIRIRLKSNISVIRLFGKRQMVDQIYLFLDKPLEFQVECRKVMDKQKDI